MAVLGIALIAMGEEIGAEMALRTFGHLVSIVTGFAGLRCPRGDLPDGFSQEEGGLLSFL